MELNKIPNLICKKFTASNSGDIQEDLCSRQLITIPFNEGIFYYKLLSDFKREIFNQLESEEYTDFSQFSKDAIDIDEERKFTDELNVCEYICSSHVFSAGRKYMNYIKKNPDIDDLIIKVYGVEHITDTDKIHDSILQNIKKDITLPIIEDFSLNMELEYYMFEETKYDVIDTESGKYYILNINIPYSYYSKIPLIDSIFTYDINHNNFYIDGEHIIIDQLPDIIRKYYENFRDSGLSKEIYISTHNHNLIPFIRQGMRIFIAKFLKIPFIPAALVVAESKPPFILNKNRKYPITPTETNDLCKPYFIFPE